MRSVGAADVLPLLLVPPQAAMSRGSPTIMPKKSVLREIYFIYTLEKEDNKKITSFVVLVFIV
jgi:hypothetical protein